jgi:hypothetical protein
MGIPLRPRKGKNEVRFWFDPELWLGLAREAGRRNMTVARLCRLVLETLVKDKLFAAVIDDVPLARRKVLPQPQPRVVTGHATASTGSSHGVCTEADRLAGRGDGSRRHCQIKVCTAVRAFDLVNPARIAAR